jgi:hypothetical protein
MKSEAPDGFLEKSTLGKMSGSFEQSELPPFLFLKHSLLQIINYLNFF